MEQTEQKPVLKRRSRQELITLLKEFEKCEGVTAKAFCQLHQIRESAFYSFRKRFHKKVKAAKPAGFVQIKPPIATSDRPGVLFAEVKGIKLYQPVSADYLKTLAS
jgi:hypothetical protein